MHAQCQCTAVSTTVYIGGYSRLCVVCLRNIEAMPVLYEHSYVLMNTVYEDQAVTTDALCTR